MTLSTVTKKEEDHEWAKAPIQYYSCGRMKYHPFYHPNQGKKYNLEELEYICKFYEVDGPDYLGMALGRPPKSISTTVTKLKKNNQFEYYQQLNRHW